MARSDFEVAALPRAGLGAGDSIRPSRPISGTERAHSSQCQIDRATKISRQEGVLLAP
jgi:hypothetical protein